MHELYSNFTATTCLDYISSYSREGIKLYQPESADAIWVEWHVSGLTAVSPAVSIDLGISDLQLKLIWLKHDVAVTPNGADMRCHMAEEMCGASAHKQDIKDQYKHFEELHFKLKCFTLCLSEMRRSILILCLCVKYTP